MKLAEIAGGRSGFCGEAAAELLRAGFFVTALSFSEVHFFVAGLSLFATLERHIVKNRYP